MSIDDPKKNINDRVMFKQRKRSMCILNTEGIYGHFQVENMFIFFAGKMLFPRQKDVFLAVLINKNERS